MLKGQLFRNMEYSPLLMSIHLELSSTITTLQTVMTYVGNNDPTISGDWTKVDILVIIPHMLPVILAINMTGPVT